MNDGYRRTIQKIYCSTSNLYNEKRIPFLHQSSGYYAGAGYSSFYTERTQGHFSAAGFLYLNSHFIEPTNGKAGKKDE